MRLRGPALTRREPALDVMRWRCSAWWRRCSCCWLTSWSWRCRTGCARLPQFRFVRAFGSHPEIGGLSLLRQPIFDVTVGLGVLVAILVLLGLRWMALAALAAAAVYWVAARQMIPWIPYPLQLLTAGGYLLETAALVGSPT